MTQVDYYNFGRSIALRVRKPEHVVFFYDQQANFTLRTRYTQKESRKILESAEQESWRTFTVPKFLDNLVAESLDLPQTSPDLRVNALLLLAYTEMARIREAQ